MAPKTEDFFVTKVGDTALGGWDLRFIGSGTRFEDDSIEIVLGKNTYSFDNLEQVAKLHPEWGILFEVTYG